MQVAAVIAEFNPLHNGHAHLIAELKKAGAAQVVAVMSGCYVQRGEPALFDKWVRAQAALSCGVDLVIELPLPYAVSGAERFARGAVSLCEALGKIDTLAFGCEAETLQSLLQVRALLDSPELPARIQRQLRENPGIPFAAARMGALRQLGGEEAAALVNGPNNSLALEYLASLEGCGSAIRPFAVRRVGAQHDAPAVAGRFASATLLRARILKEGIESALPYVPEQLGGLYPKAPLLRPPAFETAVLSRLRGLSEKQLAQLPELSEGLEHRLYAAIREARSLQELYRQMKSKRYTLARMRRLALAAFLGIEDRQTAAPPPYLRILGYTAAGRRLLEGEHRLPLGGSLKKLERLGGVCEEFARLEAAAGDQYALCCSPPGRCGREYAAGMLRI